MTSNDRKKVNTYLIASLIPPLVNSHSEIQLSSRLVLRRDLHL